MLQAQLQNERHVWVQTEYQEYTTTSTARLCFRNPNTSMSGARLGWTRKNPSPIRGGWNPGAGAPERWAAPRAVPSSSRLDGHGSLELHKLLKAFPCLPKPSAAAEGTQLTKPISPLTLTHKPIPPTELNQKLLTARWCSPGGWTHTDN